LTGYEFDHYNLPKLFSIEKIDPKLKYEELRPGQPVIFESRIAKIFSKDGELKIQIFG